MLIVQVTKIMKKMRFLNNIGKYLTKGSLLKMIKFEHINSFDINDSVFDVDLMV